MYQQGPTNKVHPQAPFVHTDAGRISCLLVPAAIVFLICVLVSDAYPGPQPAQYKEYEVKAAFIYNFLKFVDWPEEKMASSGNQITLGIIGEDPFGPAANIFKDKKVENRQLVIKRFEGIEQLRKTTEKDKTTSEELEALKGCHLLFICPSEQKQVRQIIDTVGKNSVLTVGDTSEFIESGGAISFFMEDNKIRFNINLTAAEKAGLKIRSQLLRLAKTVLKDEHASTSDNEASSSQENN